VRWRRETGRAQLTLRQLSARLSCVGLAARFPYGVAEGEGLGEDFLAGDEEVALVFFVAVEVEAAVVPDFFFAVDVEAVVVDAVVVAVSFF
jgi:hypothetical protein